MVMSESKILVCRLCKGTESLRNFYEVEGLLEKTSLCIGIQICPDDGLPSMICKFCKRNINRFYAFKQNCLRVNSELNILKQVKEASKIEIEISFLKNTELIELENVSSDISLSEGNVKIENADVKSQICQFPDKNYMYKENETDQNSFQCELCGSIYKSKMEYKTHFSSHSKMRLFQCQFCNKHFTRAESREIHMRTHLGIRPFICEICGRSSTKRQDLIRHMKIHSDERKYECRTCGRRFKRSMDLNTHNRTHTGARPYKCPNCGKGYTSHSGLRKHVKSNTCKETNVKS